MSVSSVNPTSSSRYVTFDKTQSASKFQVQETKSDNRQPVLLDEASSERPLSENRPFR